MERIEKQRHLSIKIDGILWKKIQLLHSKMRYTGEIRATLPGGKLTESAVIRMVLNEGVKVLDERWK